MRYFTFLLTLFFAGITFAQESIWLLVDTQKKVIQVRQGEAILVSFSNISVGRNGVNHKQKSGDDITPIGRYSIAYINEKSHFRKFFGLNYPSAQDAGLALYSERISYADYQRIMQAHRNNKLPPQDTILGGRIGIHGLGRGNGQVHGVIDWTHGCVAVSNQQIDQLARWVFQGMRVEIK
jgi:murein L,D-transpeptidase YafK